MCVKSSVRVGVNAVLNTTDFRLNKLNKNKQLAYFISSYGSKLAFFYYLVLTVYSTGCRMHCYRVDPTSL